MNRGKEILKEWGGVIAYLTLCICIFGGVLWVVHDGQVNRLTYKTLEPVRNGNSVTISASDGGWHGWPDNVDVIYLTLETDGEKQTSEVFAHPFLYHSSIKVYVPVSQPVHAIADVLYTNGTRIRVVDKWV